MDTEAKHQTTICRNSTALKSSGVRYIALTGVIGTKTHLIVRYKTDYHQLGNSVRPRLKVLLMLKEFALC